MQYRKTIAKSSTISGIGVHNGANAHVTFHPAAYGSGIVFQCPELISADWRHVTSTQLATTIQSSSGHGVTMVEHLLSACYGLGLTDLLIEVKGKEAPILDGSAKEYLNVLLAAGIVASEQDETRWVVVQKTIRVTDGDRWVEWRPGLPFFCARVTPDHGVIHEYSFNPLHDSFQSDIAPARTFMRLADVETMQKAGYIRGGSLDIALVWDKGNVINPGCILLDNETARHKILDMMGDFTLLGAFIFGQVYASNPGHHLNYRLMCALDDHSDAVTWCTYSQLPKHPKQSFI